MKVNQVVKKETINIAVGILVCSAITLIAFVICGKFSFAVLLGAIYGGLITLINFFLMGLTIQRVTQIEDPNMAKKKMQFSYSRRQLLLLLLVGAGMYVAVNFGTFHWLPILLAVIYPRIIIAFVGFFRKEWRSNRGDVA